LLLEHFARLTARRLGRPYEGLEPGFVARATTYAWPGNVRELENVVERALILSRGGPLDASGAVSRRPSTIREAPQPRPATLPPRDAPVEDATLEAVERMTIWKALEACAWVVEGASGAARRLGVHPSTLRWRMRKLGVHRTR
jgi:DNA-binding NtrC family response regulator